MPMAPVRVEVEVVSVVARWAIIILTWFAPLLGRRLTLALAQAAVRSLLWARVGGRWQRIGRRAVITAADG
jgi:hypothetical protein